MANWVFNYLTMNGFTDISRLSEICGWIEQNCDSSLDTNSIKATEENTVVFDTKSVPKGIIKTLSEQHPGILVADKWYNEGGWKGVVSYLNGECQTDTEESWPDRIIRD